MTEVGACNFKIQKLPQKMAIIEDNANEDMKARDPQIASPSELFRDFEKFLGPGPVRDLKIFTGPDSFIPDESSKILYGQYSRRN